MPNGPLGVTFRPTDQMAQQGPMQAGREGGLQSAIQMLSLRYPRVYGSRTPVGDPAMLAGNAPRTSGINPNAAIFQALINAFAGSELGQPGANPWMPGPVAQQPGPAMSAFMPSTPRWTAGPVDRTPGFDWAMGSPTPPATSPSFTYDVIGNPPPGYFPTPNVTAAPGPEPDPGQSGRRGFLGRDGTRLNRL